MNVWTVLPAYLGILALAITGFNFFRDRKERRKAQADQIAAWVQRASQDGDKHKLIVKNASDLPCTHLVISRTEGYMNPSRLRFSKTFGADTDGKKKPLYRHAVGPGESLVVHETAEDLAVRSLSFSDAAGRRWVRTDTGLTEPERASIKFRFDRWRYNRKYRKYLKKATQPEATGSVAATQ